VAASAARPARGPELDVDRDRIRCRIASECPIVRISGAQAEVSHVATLEPARIGKRGAFVIPARLRKRFGIREGSIVIAEEREDGILVRPAVVMPFERYTPERRAEFLLNNAVGADDYAQAVEEVRRMGLDPDKMDHVKPPGA